MSKEPDKVMLTIRYMNGEYHSFEFRSNQEEKVMLASHIQRVLNAKELMLELEDRLLVIPMQNVQTIEISPLPAKLPDIVIRGVRQLES